MTLGGTIIVHNAIEYDYCLESAVRSLCGVCDRVIVLDASSSDGTHELLTKPFLNSHINCIYTPIFGAPWKPSSMGSWLADLTNEAREMVGTDMHLNLQADEVLHEADYPLIRQLVTTNQTYTLERLNFWQDHRHILPPHEKVGSTIVRLAPVSLPCVGDAQGLEHRHGHTPSKARIYHYGFIRKAPAFVAKSRKMMAEWGWGVDPIMDKVETEGMKALCDTSNPTAMDPARLLPYKGTHPKVAHRWLQEHGYNL